MVALNQIVQITLLNLRTMLMGGPEMAPHTPHRSSRPGGAAALLYRL